MKLHRQLAVCGVLALCASAIGQTLPQTGNMTPQFSLMATAVLPAVSVQPVLIKPVPQCSRFLEPFDPDDYQGPLNGMVTRFSEGLDSATPHIADGFSSKCSMTGGEKFRLFVSNNIDPAAYMSAAWDAGWAQLDLDDPSFGQGAAGYGKRYLAAVADNVQSDFVGIYLFPAIFHQDPRYFRMGEGSVKARLEHALAHRFIARGDSGRPEINYSEWFGDAASKALSNLYHPGNERGFGPTASRVGMTIGNGMAWDVLREFWPEVAHRFRFPFRTIQDIR